MSEVDLPRLRVLATGLVRDEADVDDLVHDAWLDIATTDAPARHERGWIGAVVRNRARMRWRADARRVQREQSGAIEPTPPMSPEDGAHLSAVLESLRAELSKLGPEERALLDLRLEGLSATAIGRRRGIVPATVRTRIHRALGRLREGLDRRFGGRERWMPAVVAFGGPNSAPAPMLEGLALAPDGRIPVLELAFAALAVAAVAAAGWVVLDSRPRPPGPAGTALAATASTAAAPAATAPATHSAPAPSPVGDPSAPRAAVAAAAPPPRHAPDPPQPIRLQDALTALNEQATACRAMLPEGAAGSLRLRARTLEGGDVESIDVEHDELATDEFTECIEQCTYAVAFPSSAEWVIDVDPGHAFVAVREWGHEDDAAPIDLRGADFHTVRSRQDILNRLAEAGWSKNHGTGWTDPHSGRIFVGCTIADESVACGTRPPAS